MTPAIPSPRALFADADLDRLAGIYRTARPFPHIVLDNFLPETLATEIAKDFPPRESPVWWRYDNPLEKKLACNDLEKLDASIRQTIEVLNGPDFCQTLERLTGIHGLVGDPGLHGGGLHCIAPGGKLDVHVDYSLHPKLGLERRLNLIVYLNQSWQESWGGALELWDATMSRCEKRVVPIFNRAVLFDTGDGSFHGHPDPLECPEDVSRKSLALYYLTSPRPDATERYKARFVKRPADPDNPELERFRVQRADPNFSGALYRAQAPEISSGERDHFPEKK